MGNHWTGRAKILEAQTLVPCKAQRRRPHGRSMGCALGNQSSGVLIPVGKLLLHATTTVYGSVDFSLPVGDFKCVFFFSLVHFFHPRSRPPSWVKEIRAVRRSHHSLGTCRVRSRQCQQNRGIRNHQKSILQVEAAYSLNAYYT